jgi:uncharacterized membrane protein YgdD (TMEM256/DUF423 family)
VTERIFLAFAGLFGALSVGADAAASHLLAGDAQRLDLAQTSARYGLFHAAALLGIVGVLGRASNAKKSNLWLAIAGWCFVAGLALFCTSLDSLAAGAPHFVAILVPFGGTAFIAGWLALLVAAVVPR